nr:2K protein [Rio Bravo virus]
TQIDSTLATILICVILTVVTVVA